MGEVNSSFSLLLNGQQHVIFCSFYFCRCSRFTLMRVESSSFVISTSCRKHSGQRFVLLNAEHSNFAIFCSSAWLVLPKYTIGRPTGKKAGRLQDRCVSVLPSSSC